MRKIWAVLLCLCLLLSFVLCVGAEEGNLDLASQDQQNNQTCEHAYDAGTVTTQPTCGAAGVKTFTCTKCGATRTESVDATGQHTYNAGTVTTQPTCTTAGVKTFTCTVCSGTKTEPVASTGEHVYQNGRQVDASNHTLTCPGCNATITEAHNWNAGQITVAPTCLAEGKKVYTCTKCTATKEETVAKVAHTMTTWTTDNTNHSRSCTVSGCTYTEAGTHAWANEKVINDSTCKDKGTKSYTCSTCSATKYEDIALKTTHTYDNDCDAECNVCKAKRDAAHKFSKIWSKNGSSHWHACEVCGEKADESSHVPGPVATEERSQDCLACGYVIVARLNHVHKPDTDWDSDADGHWRTCTSCSMELEYEKHEFGTGCSGCKICGYTDPKSHIYNGIWEMDRVSHWAICTVCNQTSELEEHIPGDPATADHPQTCTKCGYVIAEFAEHEHASIDVWMFNSAEHWEVCECGEKLNMAPHDWDEGVEDKGNTIAYTCNVCGEVRIAAQEKSNFPWGALLVLLVLLLIGTVGVLAWTLLQPKKSGKFSRKQ